MNRIGAMCMAVATLLILAAAGTMTSPVAALASSVPACQNDFGSKTPVLLVHGFHEGTDVWASMTKAIQAAIPEVTVVTPFDYPDTQWVTDSSIGPKLAAVIRCLATDSKQNGGPGKVIIVAHSMGGLAVRCAVDPKCAGSGAVSQQQIGLVITLGTPNTGSLLATTGNALSTTGVIGCEVILALQTGLNLPCPDLGSWLFGANTPAAQAMAIGLDGQPSQDLSALQALPSTIPLDAIAGQVTVTTSLFGLGLFQINGPQSDLGDLVVPVASALDGAPPTSPAHPGTSTPHSGPGSGTLTISCGTVSVSDLLGPGPASVIPDVTCWHLTETTDKTWQGDVVAAVQTAAAALSSAALAAIPEFFVHNGYELGSLYKYPNFPATIGLDNHDSLSKLNWTQVTSSKATATGTLNYDNCTPDCASGTYVQYPVQLAASDPMHCTVAVYEPYSDVSQETQAYVFNRIQLTALGGNPPSYLVGSIAALPAACGSAQGTSGVSCPSSAQLVAAWNAAPATIRQSWAAPGLT